MRARAPFRRGDLRELGRLLERADEVVAMREIAAGELHENVIGLRHDVDNTLSPCLELAEWEHERGFRATYFVLHDSPYWNAPELRPTLEAIAELGHEIGIHTNALAEGLRQRREPAEILLEALDRLSAWGHVVTGTVAHGDVLCRHTNGEVQFVNDELFEECARPEQGLADRLIYGVDYSLRIDPRPLAEFGLTYDAYRVGRRALYLSDSSGRWAAPGFAEIAHDFPHPLGQLHVLQHPCWWIEAFPVRSEVVA